MLTSTFQRDNIRRLQAVSKRCLGLACVLWQQLPAAQEWGCWCQLPLLLRQVSMKASGAVSSKQRAAGCSNERSGRICGVMHQQYP